MRQMLYGYRAGNAAAGRWIAAHELWVLWVGLAWLVLWTLASCTHTATRETRTAYRFIPISGGPAAIAQRAPPVTSTTPPEPAAYVDPSVEALVDDRGSGDLLTCVERADDYEIGRRQARQLCRGAGSTAPVDCYSAAGSESLLASGQLVALCRCATSLEPANCLSELEENTLLLPSEMVAQCSPVISGLVDRDCRPVYWAPPE
jgi:hypothetical protein